MRLTEEDRQVLEGIVPSLMVGLPRVYRMASRDGLETDSRLMNFVSELMSVMDVLCALSTQVEFLRSALVRIHDECGSVCGEYESSGACHHFSCASNDHAHMLASDALNSAFGEEEENAVDGGDIFGDLGF
jgi:hypothetical protein